MAVIAVVLGISFPTIFIAGIVVAAIAVTIALIIKQGRSFEGHDERNSMLSVPGSLCGSSFPSLTRAAVYASS